MTKLQSGAIMRNGQMIVPGSKPNSLDKTSPLHPRNGKPKNFQIADNVACAHGVHPSDIEKGVLGAHKGDHPDVATGPGCKIHSGMLHVSSNGTVTAGISKTQKYFDDEPNSRLITRDHAAEDVMEHQMPSQYHRYPPIAALNGRLPAKIIK